MPTPLTNALRNDLSASLETVSAITGLGTAQIYVPGKNGLQDEKRFKENQGLFFTEPGIFSIFNFEWLAGNATALTAPNTGVIAQSLAEKYFGSADVAIGKTIEFWSYRHKVQIVGVFKDPPANSDIPVLLGVSFATLATKIVPPDYFSKADNWRWVSEILQCYVVLPEKQSVAGVAAQLPALVKKYYPGYRNGELGLQLALQPLNDIHMNEDYGTFTNDAFSVKELWALALIGIFLLVVACINFINLATAQSVLRAREIGVRKVLGSNRLQLIKQFLSETAIITLCALIIGIALAIITLPVLNQLLGKKLPQEILSHPAVLLFMAALVAAITLLAGFYPALIVSGFKPVTIFKNKLSSKAIGSISLRRALVLFQFVVAQLLVIGTIVVVKQMNFFRERSIGFTKDGIALIDLPSDSALKVKYPLLKERMQSIRGVQRTSLCMNAPVTEWIVENDLYYNNEAEKKPFKISMGFADADYYSTFDLKLVAGRLPFPSDSTREFLVNETTVKQLGLSSPQAIIGKSISFDGVLRFPVVGVLRDFNSQPFHVQMKPMALSTFYNTYSILALRIDPAQMANTMKQVQKVFREVYPTYMYDVSFLDENIERFYKAEATTAQLFRIAAGLALFISCLGLYGLVAFMAVQKTKEIGIRKVLGASVSSIVYLFSKEFMLLIGLAFLVSAPLGYYFMNQWLSDFYYHIQPGVGTFAVAIVFSVLVAWLTVGYKAIQAAMANPAKSLKSE